MNGQTDIVSYWAYISDHAKQNEKKKVIINKKNSETS